MSTATVDPTTDSAIAIAPVEVEEPVAHNEGATACPHCRKIFDAVVDWSQPPRLQGAKCPNCRLFVPARHVQQPAD